MEHQSFFQRMLNIFLAPTEAFKDLTESVTWRDWVWPLVLVILTVAIIPLFYRDITYHETLLGLQKGVKQRRDFSIMSQIGI